MATMLKIFKMFACSVSLAAIGITGLELKDKTTEPTIVYRDRVIQQTEEPEPKKRSVAEIVQEAAQKSGIPAVLINAIIQQESGGDATAIKFEAHHLGKIPQKIGHPDKRRMYASSIGLMQVMGWWVLKLAPHYDYTALFDPEFNIAMGTKILSDCLKRHATTPPHTQIRKALICYNGSEIYASEVLERVGLIALMG